MPGRTPGRLAGVLAAAVLAASCSGGSDDDGAGSSEPDDVGRLDVVAGGGDVQPGDLEQLASAAPADLDLDPGPGGTVGVAAGSADGVWLLVGNVSRSDVGLGSLVAEVTGDRVEPADALEEASPDTGIAVGSDGTVVVADADRRQLLRYRDGEVAASSPDGVTELSYLAAGDDGTVLVADNTSERIVSVTADDQVRPLVDDVVAGPLAVARDGTLYFVDRDTSHVRAVSPDGEVATVTGDGTADPSDGAPAADSSLTATALAATDEGIHLLFRNEVWRIDGDDRLDLVLRRGDEASFVGLAGGGERVYVLDDATGTISAVR